MVRHRPSRRFAAAETGTGAARSSVVAIGVLLCLWSAGSAWSGESFRARRVDQIGGNPMSSATAPQFSPDGKKLFFEARQLAASPLVVYLESRWGDADPVGLTPDYPSGQGVGFFVVAPDGGRVLYETWQQGLGYNQLWTVSADGSRTPTQIGPTAVAGGGFEGFRFSPDGTRILFYGDLEVPGLEEIWTAPADGSGPAVRLDPESPDPRGGRVHGDYEIAPDGQRVIFSGDFLVYQRTDLWSAPLDGSSPAVRLSPDLGPDADVTYGFDVNSLPGRVLFRVSDAGGYSLWVAANDGSAPAIELASTVVVGFGDEAADRVVYSADRDGDGRGEVWSVPAAGPANAAVLLAENADSSTFPGEPQFDATGDHAFFVADLAGISALEAWSVPVDGSGPPIRLSPPSPPAGWGATAIDYLAPAGLVLIEGVEQVPMRQEVWSAPADGSTAAVRLDENTMNPGVTEFGATADASRVVYLERSLSSASYELWSVSSDGSGPRSRLSPPPSGNADAGSFSIDSSGQRVYFLSDLDQVGGTELWEVPVGGPDTAAQRISPDPVPGVTGVLVAVPSPEGAGVLYSGRLTGSTPEIWTSDSMVFRADFEGGDLAEWSSVFP
jgi:hypothetical protein